MKNRSAFDWMKIGAQIGFGLVGGLLLVAVILSGGLLLLPVIFSPIGFWVLVLCLAAYFSLKLIKVAFYGCGKRR